MIILKTKQEIDTMDEANKIVHGVLDRVEENICVGITTKELDSIAVESMYGINNNAVAAFKDYRGFPASLCVSINEEVVHGIPSNRIIKDGDIVSIDFGVKYKGFVGDAARTIIVGSVSEEVNQLVHNTKEALKLGIEQMRVGNRLYDIAEAISSVAQENNYGNVKELCGHSVGKQLHEPPAVYNYINKSEPNIRLQEGMVLALEPMFTLKGSDITIMKDNWTIKTKDLSISAHWELSVAIIGGGPMVLGNK